MCEREREWPGRGGATREAVFACEAIYSRPRVNSLEKSQRNDELLVPLANQSKLEVNAGKRGKTSTRESW